MPTWTKEQKEAIEESGTNIIVSAGAGSGKTAVLSERVLYKLKNGIHIDELLILTFTRAAAEEMKDRIRKKIKKDETLKRELDALDSSYITTFDSFALSVVKKYHYLLDIKKDIAITDESIITLEKTRIIDRIFESKYGVDDLAFERLVKRFSLKSDKPLKRVIGELIKKIEGFIDRKAYIDFLKTDFWEDEHLSDIAIDYEKAIFELQKNVELELEKCYPYFESDYIQSLDDVVLPIINAKTIEELKSYKSYRLPNLKRGSDDETKKVKERFKKSIDELFKLLEYGSIDEVKKDILSTKELTLAIVDIIEHYFEELDRYKKENDIYTFSDIASYAIEILKTFEEARLELKNRFKEIMIDEYQDTNDVQETFISLIASDNVYMVGDIKQSIYRFRGSNPIIFKDKYDRYSTNSGGKKIDLIKNFRSRSEVLENINRIFDLLMDDNLGGAAYTVSHEMVYGNTAYDEKRAAATDYNCDILEYELPEDKSFTSTEIEIFAIAKDIKARLASNFQVFDKESGEMRPFKYSDAVIILDRSKFFADYKRIFEYLGIPLTILKEEELNSSIDIMIIKNIVDFILRIKEGDFGIEFRYDFLSIGRSFLYEYSDQYLFETIKNKSYKDTDLYRDFSKIIDFNSKTIYEIMLYILDTTRFYDCLYRVGDYENTNLRITKLLDIATNLSDMGYSIYEFRDYLSDIVEQDLEIKYTSSIGDSDSVKILSIHKSKGLEYPVCYFADLDHDFNTKELKSKFIADTKYGIITPLTVENEKDKDTLAKELYKRSFMREEISEKIRLFYVALTRAREKMILILPKKDTVKLEKNRVGTIEEIRRLKFKGLKDFIYGIQDYLPSYVKDLDISTLNLTKDYLYNKDIKSDEDISEEDAFEVKELDIESKEISRKRFSKDLPELLTKENKKNMDLGTKVHEILEFLDFKNYDPSSIEDEFIRSKIDGFMKSDLMKDIAQAKIYHEYEFVYEEGDFIYHGSIDLMLEYEDHIDIIDYKLKNTADEHYLDQLNGYKHYIAQISNKPVSIYLYSIIDGTVNSLN